MPKYESQGHLSREDLQKSEAARIREEIEYLHDRIDNLAVRLGKKQKENEHDAHPPEGGGAAALPDDRGRAQAGPAGEDPHPPLRRGNVPVRRGRGKANLKP